MEFGPAAWWWAAAGALIALELVTGTFYLLLIALGLAAAGFAAHAGFGASLQLLAAALVGGGAVGVGMLRSAKAPPPPPPGANPDMVLDIGERVEVPAWGSDGLARVNYRGSMWTARYEGPGEPCPGPHLILAIEGSRLVLGR